MQQQVNINTAPVKTITPVLPFKYYAMKQAYKHVNNNNDINEDDDEDINYSNDDVSLNQFGRFESNRAPVASHSMIARAFSLTPKLYAAIDPANLNMNSKININKLNVINTPQPTLVGHQVNKNLIRIAKNNTNIHPDDYKMREIFPKESEQFKMEPTHAHNVNEPRKGIFIQDEDEEGDDFADENEKKEINNEFQFTNSTVRFYYYYDSKFFYKYKMYRL